MLKAKKFVSLALATTLVLGISLTGCNSTKSDPGKKDEPASNKTDTKKGDAVLNCYFLAPQCKDLPQVEEAINKILKEKIGATVKLNYFFWDSYQDKQKLAIASGEAIDVMFSPQWWGFSNFVAQKAFLSLDDLLEKHGKDIKANINPAYLKAPRADGKLYGIPTSKDMAALNGVLVDKALADKYNFDFSKVKSPEDFEPMLKVIKEKEPGMIPFLSQKGDQTVYFTDPFYENIISRDVPVGVKKSLDEIKVFNMMETPEYIKMAKLANDWYTKGYINNDVATLKDSTPLKKQHKAFMWAEQLKPGKADEMKAQFGYDLIQVNAYGDLKPFATTNDMTNSMLVIPRTSKNPEKAMEFINQLFINKEVKNLMDWGIENKHYKKIGENQIDYADGVTSEKSGYTGVAQWAMGGNQFLDYLWVSESPDKWKKMKEFNDSAIISKTNGWTFNQDKVKTEVAALTTVNKQYGEAIGSGIVKYDEKYPACKADMEKAGVKAVIDEAQKQVDEFLKNSK